MDLEPTPAAPSFLIGYARVSTDDQHLDLQIDALLKFGVLRENIHTDTATGANTDRPGFLAMWKDLRPGDTLVIWKLDRLGRNLSQLIRTAEKIKERGAQLRVLTEAIDTTTPMGMFMFHIMGAFAELERRMIIERTKAGQAAARERGRHPGRPTAMTIEMLDEARRLMGDAAEGGEGLSVQQAARQLGVGKSTLYRELQAQEEASDDLG